MHYDPYDVINYQAHPNLHTQIQNINKTQCNLAFYFTNCNIEF